VSVDVKAKKRRVVLRRTRVKSNCKWSKKITFSSRRIPRKLRARRKQKFRFVARYQGSPSLKPARKITNARSKR
jgi:hypothetical protein